MFHYINELYNMPVKMLSQAEEKNIDNALSHFCILQCNKTNRKIKNEQMFKHKIRHNCALNISKSSSNSCDDRKSSLLARFYCLCLPYSQWWFPLVRVKLKYFIESVINSVHIQSNTHYTVFLLIAIQHPTWNGSLIYLFIFLLHYCCLHNSVECFAFRVFIWWA